MTSKKIFFKKVFWIIALLFPKNWRYGREQYPQLWYCWPDKDKRPKLRRFIYWVCGKLTGHELSETEWGSGFNGKRDRWCRWCDKMFSIPIEEDIPPKGVKEILGDQI